MDHGVGLSDGKCGSSDRLLAMVSARQILQQPSEESRGEGLSVDSRAVPAGKALLVAQHNMEEISILEDQAFRQRMAEMDGAQVWVCPSFNHGFDFTDGAWCPFVVPVCPVRFRAAGGLLRGVGPGLCGRKPTDIHTDSAQGYLSGGGDRGGLAVWTQAAYCDSDGRTGQKDILNEITRYTL